MKKEDTKNVIKLGFSSMFNDIGSEMVTTILPFFILSLGGGGFFVGLISGLREGLSSIFKLLGGRFSDKTGRRKEFIFLGYFISAVSRFSLFFSSSAIYVTSLISLERIGKLRDAPRDAVIAESVSKRGKWFAIHQLMDTSGAIIGTSLVILLFGFFSLRYSSIIFIGAIISSFSLIPLFFVKAKRIKKDKISLLSYVKSLNSNLKYYIFVSSVFTFANFGLYMFLVLRAKELTGSFIIPLILYGLFNIVWAAFTFPFGKYSDEIGRKKILLAGYSLFFLICFGFLYEDGIIYLASLFVAYGLVYAMTQSNQKALLVDLTSKHRGTAIGLYYFFIGIANVLGGIVGGLLWENSPKTMFAFLAFVGFISIILLIFVKEPLKESEQIILENTKN